MQIEFTEEMLDAIEAVKGVRDPQMWDPNCKRYMESQQNLKKDVLRKMKLFMQIDLMIRLKD